jgi:hypothetical protein
VTDEPKDFQQGPPLFGIPVRMVLDSMRVAGRRRHHGLETNAPKLVELALEQTNDEALWITIHALPADATGLGLAVGKEYDVYITVREVVE